MDAFTATAVTAVTADPTYPRASLAMESTADAVVRDVVAALPELAAAPCDRDAVGCDVQP